MEALGSQSRWEHLKKSVSYRAFLQAYLQERELSLSDLARAAGVVRGFPGEVIAGRRRLSSRSLRSFERALKLPPAGRKFFRFLVAKEEKDLFPDLASESIERTLEDLRKKDWQRNRREIASSRSTNEVNAVLKDANCLAVYAAAAGGVQHENSLEKILGRTGLTSQEVLDASRLLIRAGLLEKKDDLFISSDLHVALKSEEMGATFKSLFQAGCARASKRAQMTTAQDADLFFTSTFCIQQQKLPELKLELRQLLLKFVDDCIDSDGDRVVHLTTGLHL